MFSLHRVWMLAVTLLKYIQHSPRAADGVEGLKGFINGYLKKANPRLRAEIKRVIVQGDLVVLHVHSLPEPGALGSAIIDISGLRTARLSSTGM